MAARVPSPAGYLKVSRSESRDEGDGEAGSGIDEDHNEAFLLPAGGASSSSLPRRSRGRSGMWQTCCLIPAVICLAWAIALVLSEREPPSQTPPATVDTHRRPVPMFKGAAAGGVSLYCFMVVLPFGYERKLVRMQFERGLSVFGCDAHSIFSNETFELVPGSGGERTIAVVGDMSARLNTWTWEKYDVALALNTDVFIRFWKKVIDMGLWMNYDWTLKCEADTVFFPQRLQDILRARPLLPNPTSGSSLESCDTCSLPRMFSDSCAAHAQWEQKQGLTCREALDRIKRPPPLDCGCACDESACIKPGSVYLRNCATNFYTPEQPNPAPALHGPLEVMSRGAWQDFSDGIDQCAQHFKDDAKQWGEDWFLEHCLQDLGVSPVDAWSSLSDLDCDPYNQNDGTCRYAAAAFQPFKTAGKYLECYNNAKSIHWRPDLK